ncbi:hypothetical protein LGT39_08365 [Demequina sp. TTPB684]|uniref:hypothetical protein n=1 Tax=unclassified Demequina TaxID=2620311 RepID=UPI001CF53430|nr:MULTISPECIES: hypothetical protein [unclassified Demequina]MCB2412858.1 hypothetical protein [Demequina sp. TTPB684]UPU88165.1 hypothetical protein LGT36_013095 [Demequina sp. TMPB413]
MTHHAVHALRAVLVAIGAWAFFMLTSAPAGAATESVDPTTTAASTHSELLSISGLALMGTGIVLMAISLVLRRRAAR